MRLPRGKSSKHPQNERVGPRTRIRFRMRVSSAWRSFESNSKNCCARDTSAPQNIMTIPSTTRVKLEQGSRHKRTLNGVKAIVLRFQKLQFHSPCEGHAHLRKRKHASSRHGEVYRQTKDWKTTTKRHIKTQKISTRLRFTVASSRRLGSFPPFHVGKMRFNNNAQCRAFSSRSPVRSRTTETKKALNTASKKITFDSTGLELSDLDSL